MKNILDELDDWDLFHLTKIADVDGEYRKAMDKPIKLETNLIKAYPDCRAMLDEYQTADIVCIICQTAMSFIKDLEQTHS